MTLCQLLAEQLDRITSHSRIPIQWQEICSNRKNTLWTQLWKTFMEEKPDGANKVSKVRRIFYWTTTKLGEGYKVNGNSKKSYEKAIWQEEMKSTRIEGREQCMVRSQKYTFKLTLKEARPEKIWIL